MMSYSIGYIYACPKGHGQEKNINYNGIIGSDMHLNFQNGDTDLTFIKWMFHVSLSKQVIN